MQYLPNEDQKLLRESAADFVKNESPVSRLRELRDGGDTLGFSRSMWSRMAELGWPGILVPQAYGGLGLGLTELAGVLEEFGRNLVPEPLLSVSCLGALPLALAGEERQKQERLGAVADGSLLVTCAYHERGARYQALSARTTARAKDRRWVLEGEKTLVLDGPGADAFVVSARTSGEPDAQDGITLFLVDRGTPGLEIRPLETVDARARALVVLRGVEVGEDALLGRPGEGAPVLERTIDFATAALSAELLGNAEGAFAMTLEYLKTRRQFGVLIGSFQALKHRCAHLFTEIELTRSAVLGACHALDRGAADASSWVSVAKARASDTAVLAGYEGIQMHGGIGMTDEHDIGFYAKRARASELTFGDASFHRARFAERAGF